MTELELKYQVLRFYELNPEKATMFQRELEFLKGANGFAEVVFPYNETRGLLNAPIKVTPDDKFGTTKVEITEGLSIFYPAKFSIGYCENAARLLMCEQSIISPHKYVKAPEDCAVLDVGCSEGFFSRVYCDKSNQVIGFDEEDWADAYLATCSDFDAEMYGVLVDGNFDINCIKLNKPLGCIKIDVEGGELEVLRVFKPLIDRYHPQIQVAVYHYLEESNHVIYWLNNNGYKNFGQVNPDSWMLYPNDDIQFEPYFRHGVIIST